MTQQEIRTQVAIVGAGPSGLLLSHLLHLHGIESVVIEHRSRAYVENRVRAGQLEPATVKALTDAGVGDRLNKQGLSHPGVLFQYNGMRRRMDLQQLTGQSITIYGQAEIQKDLNQQRDKDGGVLLYEVSNVELHEVTSNKPSITFDHEGTKKKIVCDYIAGCDGFHGICRRAIAEHLTIFDKEHPFAWLGVLAETSPVSDELVYACHERGFALFSMRSPTISRLYLQCSPQDDINKYTEDDIWGELRTRLEDSSSVLQSGTILEKSIIKLRSFMVEPLQFGNVFLVGDAAHIVPPSAAKGLNSAVADVMLLTEAIEHSYSAKNSRFLETYSKTALERLWETQRFSHEMTTLLHTLDNGTPFDRSVQVAELNTLFSSPTAALNFAKSYVGIR